MMVPGYQLTYLCQRVTLLTFVFNFLSAYFCTDISVNVTQESPVFQLSVEENRISYIITCTNHFRSDYVPKSCFCRKKAVHCGGALLKKRKRFSLYLLNSYKYCTNFNRFDSQQVLSHRQISPWRMVPGYQLTKYI